jgi:hypothetical protein
MLTGSRSALELLLLKTSRLRTKTYCTLYVYRCPRDHQTRLAFSQGHGHNLVRSRRRLDISQDTSRCLEDCPCKSGWIEQTILILFSQAVQASKALEHLHSFDVVHGNIYPVPCNECSRAVHLILTNCDHHRAISSSQTKDMLSSPMPRCTPSLVKRHSVINVMRYFHLKIFPLTIHRNCRRPQHL